MEYITRKTPNCTRQRPRARHAIARQVAKATADRLYVNLLHLENWRQRLPAGPFHGEFATVEITQLRPRRRQLNARMRAARQSIKVIFYTLPKMGFAS
jgi:hypothetical protein